MSSKSYRILSQDRMVDNDTWSTGLNNNDLIIGPSGAGKTRGYVKPNIMQCSESMIIADTKGSLVDELGPLLRENGYRVLNIDFKSLEQSTCGYNPLDYVRYDRRRRKYREQDIITIASALSPTKSLKEPFWEDAGRMYLTSIIAYVLECLPRREHSLKYVVELLSEIQSGKFRQLLGELRAVRPDSFAVQTFRLFENNTAAERMESSITGLLGEKLNSLSFDAAIRLYTRRRRIDFRAIGREKTAVFLTISDTDRSMDRMVSLFYTQALHELCDSADMEYPDHRLPVPVRFILDDFATNAYIPDFQNIISVIRSREICVSIILQNITQLTALYGNANASTIINNCDNCLYLGGQDVETAQVMSLKANRTVDTILNMPLTEAWLFSRGQPPQKTRKFDIRRHAKYHLLPEAERDRAPGIQPEPAAAPAPRSEAERQL